MTMREAGGLGQLCCCLRNKYMDPPIVSVGGHEGQVCLPSMVPSLGVSFAHSGRRGIPGPGWLASKRT